MEVETGMVRVGKVLLYDAGYTAAAVRPVRKQAVRESRKYDRCRQDQAGKQYGFRNDRETTGEQEAACSKSCARQQD